MNPAESSLPLPVPLSAARVRGALIYTSGQVGTDPQTRGVPGDLKQEMRRAMDNLGRALAGAVDYSTGPEDDRVHRTSGGLRPDQRGVPRLLRVAVPGAHHDHHRAGRSAVSVRDRGGGVHSASAEPLRPRVGAEARDIPAARHYRWDDMPKDELNPLLHRRLISTERMMLAHVYLEPAASCRAFARERAADLHPRRGLRLLARRGRSADRRRRCRRGAPYPLVPRPSCGGAGADARCRHLLSAAPGLARRKRRVPEGSWTWASLTRSRSSAARAAGSGAPWPRNWSTRAPRSRSRARRRHSPARGEEIAERGGAGVHAVAADLALPGEPTRVVEVVSRPLWPARHPDRPTPAGLRQARSRRSSLADWYRAVALLLEARSRRPQPRCRG